MNQEQKTLSDDSRSRSPLIRKGMGVATLRSQEAAVVLGTAEEGPQEGKASLEERFGDLRPRGQGHWHKDNWKEGLA